MDLGSYDDANLHNRLMEYQLNRPGIVIQQKPDETLERRLDVRRLAYRAFNNLFTPKDVISELKERRNKSESHNKEVEGVMVIDEFIFDSDNELIAGIRYRTVAHGIMEVERVVYRSLHGIGLVLLYKKGMVNLEWDNPLKVTGIQIDADGRLVGNLLDMLKIYQQMEDSSTKQEKKEPEILIV